MPYVVINKCYGGYGLSHEAIMLYAKYKKITLFAQEGHWSSYTYYTKPPEEIKEGDEESCIFSYDDIKRDDPILVKVVRELKGKASGDFGDLKIVRIPKDVKWEIEEYDGVEWVSEVHRTWG